MLLGIVISEKEVKLGENFTWLPFTEARAWDGTPTMCVGMESTGEVFDKELDVMDRKIDENTFWTFTRKEHRTHHAEDIMDFVDFCYNRLIDKVEYKFIDPLLMSEDDHTNLFNKIKGGDYLVSYKDKDMVYMYERYGDGVIYGINLMFYQYMGIDRERMLGRINAISGVLLEGDDILIEYEDFMDAYCEQVQYIPYLHSIRKHVN